MANDVTIEEHWRSVLLERLQKMESTMETVQSALGEVKTSSAVAAMESKSRSESLGRVEIDLKDLTKAIRDLERKISEPPRGQEELEKRIKVLEDWQNNLTGRMMVVGAICASGIAILTSVFTALIVNALKGS